MTKYVMVVLLIGTTLLLDPLNLGIGHNGIARADANGESGGTRGVPQYAINQPLGNADIDSSLHYVTSHSCLGDSVPPAPVNGLRVSKVSFPKKVGPITPPTLAALPLSTPGLRPGWVILLVENLDASFFASPCAGANNDCLGPDRYVIEESSNSNGSWAVIDQMNFSFSTSSFSRPDFRGLYGQSRFYRVRFYPGARRWNGCVLDTNVTKAQIPDKVKVQIQNHLTATTNNDLRFDSKIVRVRLAADLTTLHRRSAIPDPENLTKDACQPEDASVDQILPKGIWPGTNNYYELDDGLSLNIPFIHIGLGDWAVGDPPCGGPNQRKRPFFISSAPTTSGQPVYRYVEFNLQGRFGSTVIDFTSNMGNVTILMQAMNSGVTVSPVSNFLQSSTPSSDPIIP